MALSEMDYLILARQIRELLGEFDPAAAEPVLASAGRYEGPREYLIGLIRTLIRYYSERSAGQNAAILDRINSHVRLPDGSPIRGLSVTLTPIESELYGAEEVSLAELPDRTGFVAELETVLAAILREDEDGNENENTRESQ